MRYRREEYAAEMGNFECGMTEEHHIYFYEECCCFMNVYILPDGDEVFYMRDKIFCIKDNILRITDKRFGIIDKICKNLKDTRV